MGFGLVCDYINETPVLYEMLCESDVQIVSLLITKNNGDKNQALDCDLDKIDYQNHNSLFQSQNKVDYVQINAAIPIKTGDCIVFATLNKETNELYASCTPIWFIDDWGASGPSTGDTHDFWKEIDSFIRFTKAPPDEKFAVENESQNHRYNPAILIASFNVINPRNAIPYYLPVK